MSETETYWGTSGQNWMIFLIAAGVSIAGVALGCWMQRLGRATGGKDSTDWHTGLVIGMTFGWLVAVLAGIIAVVAYVILLGNGWLPIWMMVLPIGAVAYAVVRVNRWAASRVQERQR